MISSMDSVAAVLGSRSAAWYTRSRRSSSAARTVSSLTFTYRRLSAASCGGRLPPPGGWAPPPSTRHGTSAPPSAGRFAIRPRVAVVRDAPRGGPRLVGGVDRRRFLGAGFEPGGPPRLELAPGLRVGGEVALTAVQVLVHGDPEAADLVLMRKEPGHEVRVVL